MCCLYAFVVSPVAVWPVIVFPTVGGPRGPLVTLAVPWAASCLASRSFHFIYEE